MPFGDIMAIVLSTRADEPVLAAAEALSNAHDVHVSATLVSAAQVSAYGFDTVGAAAAAGAWSEPPAIINRDDHGRIRTLPAARETIWRRDAVTGGDLADPVADVTMIGVEPAAKMARRAAPGHPDFVSDRLSRKSHIRIRPVGVTK